jgi:hypothetical protein
LGYAEKNGNNIGDRAVIPTKVGRFPITIKHLIPGTTYIFQARATNNHKQGFTDWGDPYRYMAT